MCIAQMFSFILSLPGRALTKVTRIKTYMPNKIDYASTSYTFM